MGNDKQENMQSQEYERIKDLAVRHAQGITDEAEERELHTWLAEDQQREEMFQRLMSREAWNANLRRFVKSPEEEEPSHAPIQKGDKIGRNDPCPCGSGKKYKNCCGRDK